MPSITQLKLLLGGRQRRAPGPPRSKPEILADLEARWAAYDALPLAQRRLVDHDRWVPTCVTRALLHRALRDGFQSLDSFPRYKPTETSRNRRIRQRMELVARRQERLRLLYQQFPYTTEDGQSV